MANTWTPIAPPFIISQIELTSFCDMKCSYCPHPTMERVKGHMSPETLAKCTDYAKKRGQKRLVIHHFGESLLHPKLEDRMMQIAGSGLEIEFSTNGLLLEKRWEMLLRIPTKLYITLSMHQWAKEPPEQYFAAFKEWKKRAAGTNIIFQKAFNAAEGYKFTFHKWGKGKPGEWNFNKRCSFLRENMGVVLWDGRIVSCCVDAEGESVFANIHDEDLSNLRSVSWSACDTCDVMQYRRRGHKLFGMHGFFRHYHEMNPKDAIRQFYIGVKHFLWSYKR